MVKGRWILAAALIALLVGGGPLVAEKTAVPDTAEGILEEILRIKASVESDLSDEDSRRLAALYRTYVYRTTGVTGLGGGQGAEDCASASTFSASFTDSDDTTGAVDDVGEATACATGMPFAGTGVGGDLMYEIVPPADALLNVAVTDSAGTDLNVRVLDSSLVGGDPCSDADTACAAISDQFFGGMNTESVSIPVTGGTSYVVVVDGYGGEEGGPYDMEVELVLPPENDQCANSLPIGCDAPIIGSNANATQDGVGVCGSSAEGDATVWYTFTSPGNGPVTINTCGAGTDFDTQLDVFTGDCGGLACLTGNDDSCGLQSEVTFTAESQTQYRIMIHGFGTATGNYELNVDCTDPAFEFILPTIEVPTMTGVGLALMAGLLLAFSVVFMRRRRDDAA